MQFEIVTVQFFIPLCIFRIYHSMWCKIENDDWILTERIWQMLSIRVRKSLRITTTITRTTTTKMNVNLVNFMDINTFHSSSRNGCMILIPITNGWELLLVNLCWPMLVIKLFLNFRWPCEEIMTYPFGLISIIIVS